MTDDKMKMPTNNTRKAIADLIAGGKLSKEAREKLQWAAQHDTLFYLEKLYDLPIIRVSVFIKENKTIGMIFLVLFLIAFELWHLPEFRIPILVKLGFPEVWFGE